MAEQIGIRSEVENVKSEVDHVNAIFTVATGPMGRQEINYHLIDGDRDHPTVRLSLPFRPSIDESSLKSPPSPVQSRRTIELFDSKVPNTSSDNITKNEVEIKQPGNGYRKARFSLPEIDSSNQQEKKYPNKTVKKLWKSIPKSRYQQFDLNIDSTISSLKAPITNMYKEEEPSSRFSNEPSLAIPESCRPIVNNTLQHQAESLLPFYTINELAPHNQSTDAWICIFSHIYDITSLIKKIQGTPAYQQMIDYAGQDISSWFDEQTREPRKRIDPHTHQSVHVVPNLSMIESLGPPFWQTNDLLIGRLTEHSRYIRLVHNFSPKQPYLLEVGEEETIGQIARKFLRYNSHIFSYLWQYNGRILDFSRTLTENGIPNEESFHDRYGWRSDNENCPTIILSFSDDLTIA